MSIKDTPFLSESEAGELFRRMSAKSKTERRKLRALRMPSAGASREEDQPLTPRQLLHLLKRQRRTRGGLNVQQDHS